MLTPFGRANLPKVPSVIQVITASVLAHRPEEVMLGERDLLVSPPISSAIGFMDWSRHSELYVEAYDWTKRWIEDRLSESDPKLLQILGIPSGHELSQAIGSRGVFGG